jgi:hypothetical protein
MEQHILRIRQLSSDLMERLDECGFEEIDAYMKERTSLFEEMVLLQGEMPFRGEHAIEAGRVLEMDRRIVERMRVVQIQLGAEADKLQSGKKSKSVYESPKNYSLESYFFDSKR